MALIFQDPNTAGPFQSFQVKDVVTKVFKLTYANFGTTQVNTLIGALPADASIIEADLWTKTQLAGNSISAATFKLGATSNGTDFVNGVSAFDTAGVYKAISPISGICQAYNPPYASDIPLWFGGTATTGNPTSGELYLVIKYVR